MQSKRGELVPIAEALADLPARSRRSYPRLLRGTTSRKPTRWTSLLRPAKRTPTGASWRGCWRCARCPVELPPFGGQLSACGQSRAFEVHGGLMVDG